LAKKTFHTFLCEYNNLDGEYTRMQSNILYIDSVAYLTDHIPSACSWQEFFGHAIAMEFELVHNIQANLWE
jgi:hypothetical protein